MEGQTILGGAGGVRGEVLVEDFDGGGVAGGVDGRHVEGRLVLAVDQVVCVIHSAVLGSGAESATAKELIRRSKWHNICSSISACFICLDLA